MEGKEKGGLNARDIFLKCEVKVMSTQNLCFNLSKAIIKLSSVKEHKETKETDS